MTDVVVQHVAVPVASLYDLCLVYIVENRIRYDDQRLPVDVVEALQQTDAFVVSNREPIWTDMVVWRLLDEKSVHPFLPGLQQILGQVAGFAPSGLIAGVELRADVVHIWRVATAKLQGQMLVPGLRHVQVCVKRHDVLAVLGHDLCLIDVARCRQLLTLPSSNTLVMSNLPTRLVVMPLDPSQRQRLVVLRVRSSHGKTSLHAKVFCVRYRLDQTRDAAPLVDVAAACEERRFDTRGTHLVDAVACSPLLLVMCLTSATTSLLYVWDLGRPDSQPQVVHQAPEQVQRAFAVSANLVLLADRSRIYRVVIPQGVVLGESLTFAGMSELLTARGHASNMAVGFNRVHDVHVLIGTRCLASAVLERHGSVLLELDMTDMRLVRAIPDMGKVFCLVPGILLSNASEWTAPPPMSDHEVEEMLASTRTTWTPPEAQAQRTSRLRRCMIL